MTQRFHSPSGKKSKLNPCSACRVLLPLVAAACLNAIPHASALLVVQPDTSANRVDSFYWAEPGSEHGNADIPDPNDDAHVTVQLTDSTCWDYRRDPDFEGSGWDSIGPYSALLQYEASNPVCAYAGGWDGPLKKKDTCVDGGGGGGTGSGGGPGTPPEFTLDIEGTANELWVDPGFAKVALGDSRSYTSHSATPCTPANLYSNVTWSINPSAGVGFSAAGATATAGSPAAGPAQPGYYIIEANDNASALVAGAMHVAVKVDSLSGGGETCTDANAASPPTIYVGLDEEITFSAQPDPPGSFPAGEPDWEIEGPAATITDGGDEEDTATVKFTTPTTDTTNPTVVKVRCGPDDIWKAIRVIAVQIDLSLTNHFASDGATVYKIDTGTADYHASITAPGGITVASYEWHFGDGDTSTTSSDTVQHVYPSLNAYSATVKLHTPAAGTISSQPIEVVLDYSNVYPAVFHAGSSLDFPGKEAWYNARVARLTPRTGVNLLEYDALTQIPCSDFDPTDHEHPICDGTAYPNPLFAPQDPSLYPDPDSGGIVTVTSTSSDASQTSYPSSNSSPSQKNFIEALSVISDHLLAQSDALDEARGLAPEVLDARNKCATMMSRHGVLQAKFNDLKLKLADPFATEQQNKDAYSEFRTALKETNGATKDFAETARDLINALNDKVKDYDIPTEVAESLKQNAGKVTEALDKVAEVTGIVSDAFDAFSVGKDLLEDIQKVYDEMFEKAFEDDAGKFDNLLPGADYGPPINWAFQEVILLHCDNNPPPWNVAELEQYLKWAKASYMELPYETRYHLIKKWFIEHNNGTEVYWTPIVFRNADLAFWTQVKVGWIGTDFLLRKLFPGYAKLKDAMDALEDIEYFFDPRSDLAL